MPLVGEAKREYQRKWIAKRRSDFFSDKVCVKCGSSECLQLDHIDPKTKVSNSIWSWSKERREAEIKKCQVLCENCHKTKSIENGDYSHKPRRGSLNGQSILNEDQVEEIRSLYAKGDKTQSEIGQMYGVSRQTVGHVITGYHW